MIQQEKRACVMVAHRGPVVLGKRRTLNYEKRPLNAATRSQRVLSRSDLGPSPHAGAPRAARSRLRPGKAPPSLQGAPRVPGQNTERGHTRLTCRGRAVRPQPGQRAPGAGESARVAEGGPRFLRLRLLCAPRTRPLQPAPAPWATRPVRQPCRGPQGLQAVSRHPEATHAPDQRPPGAQEATHARDRRPPRLSSGPCAAFSTGRVVVA